MNTKIIDPFEIRCPECGYPLRFEHNKTYGIPLYICTNDPELCGFMTNSREYKKDIFKCTVCEKNGRDGYMIVKLNKKTGSPLYGCTNYGKEDIRCRNTVPIVTEEEGESEDDE